MTYENLPNLHEINVPKEEIKKVGCCWRLFCPCYYLFCCCCCCEQGMKITKNRFTYRFNKWISLVSIYTPLLTYLVENKTNWRRKLRRVWPCHRAD